MSNTHPKSLVLLDIDGALSPVCARQCDHSGQPLDPPRPEHEHIVPGAAYAWSAELPGSGFTTRHAIEFLAWLQDPGNQDRLGFEPRWHTGWRDDADRFAAAFGLPGLPQFADHSAHREPGADWKVEAIVEWLSDPASGDAVIVWIEDEISPAMRREIRKRVGKKAAPRLICVKTDTWRGITPQQVRFVRTCLNI